MRDVNEEYHASYLEEASVLRKIENLQHNHAPSSKLSIGKTVSFMNPSSTYCDIKSIPNTFGSITETILRHRYREEPNKTILNHNSYEHNTNTEHTDTKGTTNFYNQLECEELYDKLRELKAERKELDKLRSSTAIQRNLVYPLAMLMLLFLTGITVLVVVQNTLELLIGIKALPLSTRVNVIS